MGDGEFYFNKNLLQEWKGVETCQDYKDFQCLVYIRSYDNSLDYTFLVLILYLFSTILLPFQNFITV